MLEDRFSGATIVKSAPPTAERVNAWLANKCGPPAVSWIASIPHAGAKSKLSVAMVTMAVCDDWRFLSCYKVAALVNGEIVELGEQRRDSEIKSGDDVREYVMVQIPPATLARLEVADSLELRQCTAEWKPTPFELAEMREFAVQVRKVIGAATKP